MNSPIKKLNLRIKTLLAIVITVFILVLVVIWAFLINSSEITTNFNMMNQGPSLEHIFGTDWIGKDNSNFTQRIRS